MNQWKVILATLLIFGSGLGTGYLMRDRAAPNPPDTPGNSPNERRKFAPANGGGNSGRTTQRPLFFRSVGFLDRHLDLTEEQTDQIQTIMQGSHKRIREFGAPFRDQLKEEHQNVQKQIRDVLTADQAKKLDGLPHFRFNGENGRPGGRPPHHRPGGPHLPNKPQSQRPAKPPVQPKAPPAPAKDNKSVETLPDLKAA